MTPTDVGSFDFVTGDYVLEVFGKTVGDDAVSLLSTIRLKIDANEAAQLRQPDHGIYFDWGPDAERYMTKIEGRRSKGVDPLEFLEALQAGSAAPQAKALTQKLPDAPKD